MPQNVEASVFVTGGGGTYEFADTTLHSADTGDSLSLYTSAFTAQHGITYELSVTIIGMQSIHASCVIPGHAVLGLLGTDVLNFPGDFPPTRQFTLTAALSESAHGYYIRAYVEYELADSSGGSTFRREIPFSFKDTTYSLEQAVFPTVNAKKQSSTALNFLNAGYTAVLTDIVRTAGSSVKFRKVLFFILQLDEYYYSYYSVTNGFQDPFSTRLDRPVYSNIEGGYGLFGGLGVDSLVHALPSDFSF